MCCVCVVACMFASFVMSGVHVACFVLRVVCVVCCVLCALFFFVVCGVCVV